MQVYDLVANIIVDLGFDFVFGMVGDGAGLLEACCKNDNLKIYTANDQRIGVAMASGYSMATKNSSLYLATQGPALANISMPLLEAKSQCLPIIIIGEGVARSIKGTHAFQEFDSINFMNALVKWQYRVESIERLSWALEYGSYLAINGKPGPVYIELPSDILQLPYNTKEYNKYSLGKPLVRNLYLPSFDQLIAAADLIKKSKKVVIIAGGGCIKSDAREILVKFTHKTHAALLCTASGRGIFPESNEFFMGLSGLYLAPCLNELIKEADLFIFLGTQTEETSLIGMRHIIDHKRCCAVNVAYEDINCSVKCEQVLIGDVKITLEALLPILELRTNNNWYDKILETRKGLLNLYKEKSSYQSFPIKFLCQELNQLQEEIPINLLFENGINELWLYCFPMLMGDNIRYYVPGEHTGLGLAYGNALGICCSSNNMTTIVVTGDGAFSYGQMALIKAKEFGFGIVFIILNNHAFGWPKYQQRKKGISCGVDNVLNIEKIAISSKALYLKPENDQDLKNMLQDSIKNCHRGICTLIEIDIKEKENYPEDVLKHY
jgi:acetolactate synthase-1/2/3 large subunit